MKNTIDFDAAIKQGKLSFAEAVKLSGMTIDDAIKADLLTFAQALDLQGIAIEASASAAPKVPKAPKVEAPKPKAEVPDDPEPAEFSYTKGGAVIQYAGHNTLKPNHLRRGKNAIERLVKAGFCVSWKRIGGWVWIDHSKKADGKTSAEFKAALALLPDGWEIHGGSIVDKNMLADYEDNFRPEK